MSDILVKVEGVSKKFCKSLKLSMLYGVKDVGMSMLGIAPDNEKLRNNEFWAVDDVSFELKRGECLGLIGPNGSGKSTLLKLLNGIISPDKGRIKINGRVGSLIEVGAGFHPMLTGRENIYVNGAILGFSKKDITKKFNDIVEFSELGDFIDAPVKHYSSGMYVRLGFAIAAQMEPDVLLIDEVLAVGDVGFQSKCFNVIANMLKNAAIIFVSHSMSQIARICNNILLLDHGYMLYKDNNIPEGINQYYSQVDIKIDFVAGNGEATIDKIELRDKNANEIEHINYLDDLYFHMIVKISYKVIKPIIYISILDQNQQLIAQTSSFLNNITIENTGKPIDLTIKIPNINLNTGLYVISTGVVNEESNEILVQYYAVKKLRIEGHFCGAAPVQLNSEWLLH